MRKLKMFLGALVCFCLIGAVCIHVYGWLKVKQEYDAILAGYDDLIAAYRAISASYDDAFYRAVSANPVMANAEKEVYEQELKRIEEAIRKVADEEYFKRLVAEYGEEEAKIQQDFRLAYLRLEYDEVANLARCLQEDLKCDKENPAENSSDSELIHNVSD